MTELRILIVCGTRPEAVKLIPVYDELKRSELFSVKLLATGQHKELVQQAFDVFNVKPDYYLNVMTPNQSLADLTSRMIQKVSNFLQDFPQDLVLVQGDTTTVLASALAAFYQKIPVGHVEAGLRTHDIANPFPEEMNRQLVSRIAKWHFAPTQNAKRNLIAEGISEESIFVTGNTVIDTLLGLKEKDSWPVRDPQARKRILVTVHRRENFGDALLNICNAINIISEMYPEDIAFDIPLHPNPNVRSILSERLKDNVLVSLSGPLDYLDFVRKLKDSYIVMTDSGGVQEEAPALGVPVLILRDETERPEAVHEGVATLVGSNTESIVKAFVTLMNNKDVYDYMSRGASPYGDGNASRRIFDVLSKYRTELVERI